MRLRRGRYIKPGGKILIRKLSLFVLGVLGIAGLALSGPLGARAAPTFVTTQGSSITYQGQTVLLRGVNFNNEPALACCGGPNINLINANQSDYVQAHALGINHLRWGLDYNWYATNRTQFFSVVDQHLAWAAQNQLWVYLVDFIPPGGSSGGFDQHYPTYCIWSDCPTATTNQDLLNSFWQDVATHYANNPTVIGYDLLNEPAPPSDSEWASLATRLFNTVTTADPNHLGIIEAPLSNDLSLFSQNTRVIYSVHNYPGGDNFPGGQPASTPLLVGEFGDTRVSSTAVSFVNSEVTRYNAAGVSWTYFVWREDSAGFGLYVDPAGDFSQPWTPMISVVQAGWAGNVLPPASGSPGPSPTPSPSPTPPPPAPSGGVPVYDHIFELLMENTPYSGIIGNSAAPYINSLAAQGAVGGNYSATDHPSLPNYAELTSGQSFPNASSDCDPSSSCQSSAVNLIDRVVASGRTWHSYQESMGSACGKVTSGLYAPKHNPFVYYTDISAASCAANVVDYSHLAGDLASTSTTSSYVFITPNLCNDMHDCSTQTGDTWLSQNVPTILGSPAFTQQHSLLVIVWDEDDGSGSNQVALLANGYGVKTAFISMVNYNHYSLLKTIETSWGLSPVTTTDAAATPMTDLFGTSGGTPLTASSSASATAGDAPLGVNFTGTASGGTPPYSYSWNFGDTATSTTQNPSHTYSTAGTFAANLTVTDSASHTATASALSITVSPALSVTASASSTAGNAPLTVNFTGTPSGGRTPYTYAWTFGDAGVSTIQNPSHVYAGAGSFTTNLKVTDANGISASSAALNISVNGALVASASAFPAAGDAPFSTAFAGSVRGGTPTYSYAWTFGDSTGSTSQSPGHTYTNAGTYTATLTVTDAVAHTSTATVTVVVSPTLSASASATPTSGDAPIAVAFTGTPSGGLAPYAYTWMFGDGLSSGSQSPNHTYAAAGTYSAILTVTDANHVAVSTNTVVITVQPPPTVSASASPRTGDAPLPVAFVGTPAGGTQPYLYSWTFGDGGTSTLQSPSHTYAAGGSYSAQLTLTDGLGSKATATVTLSINPPPVASATASPSEGDAPLTVSFSGSTSGGTAPFSYGWAFGDGGTSTSQSPTHGYAVAGTYTATLTVTDSATRTATATSTVTVSPSLGASAAATPTVGNTPLAVAFTGTPSGGLAPYAYAWTFGDGGTSTQQNPSHTYTSVGTFSAGLTISDAYGAKAVATAVTITVNGPLAASASGSPLAGDAPLPVAFTGSAVGGATPYTYTWTFGDNSAGSSVQSPSHTYASSGTYTATLTVTDAGAHTATATVTVAVSPSLSASASASPNAGDAPLTVAFTGAAAGGLGPFSYTWTFGDGGTSAVQNPSRIYSAAGTYTANLTVTDANLVSVGAAALTITVQPSLTLSAVGSPTTGDAPLTVAFTSTPLGGTSPYGYAWAFGDGGASNTQNPSHIFNAAGNHIAQLTVTDSAGHSVGASVVVTVNPPPAATAGANPMVGDAPLMVTFSGTATGGTGSFSYAWTFGDGTNANTQIPIHTYTVSGTFTAQLTATDASGRSASASAIVTVNPPPLATAVASPTSGRVPLAVSFTASASSGTGPYTYAWTFGDGGTSNIQSPSHTYTVAGTYNAGLTVTDAGGVRATATAGPITVSGPLAASASVVPAAGDAPVNATFTGSAGGGTSPYTYSWAFGDTTISNSQNPSHTYTAAGRYIATLTVTDAAGGTATATATVLVAPTLGATVSASPSSGDAPLTVAFTGTATGGKSPFAYAWDFGDGGTSTSLNPNHTYSAAGTYTVTLTVSDANAAAASATALSITVQPALGVSAFASPSTGDAPLAVTFVSGPFGGTVPYSYAWTFGDGASSTLPSPNHTYSAAGAYTADLTVTDSAGRTATATLSVSVSPALAATASAVTTTGDAPVTVGFAGSASGGALPYSYAWSFGDGASSTSQNPSHGYAAAGTFSVALTVTDGTGRSAAATLSITVSPALSANASASPTMGAAPVTVGFVGTLNGGRAPYTYAWGFGDGATSNSQNPSHAYLAAGTFTALLTVTDANGATVLATAGPITVNGPLVALAGAIPAAGDAPLLVAFSGSAAGGVLSYSYVWAFGDGTSSTGQNPGHTYASPGTYTATLTVTDGAARTATATATVVVSPTLGATASATPSSGVAPVTVAFTAVAAGGNPPLRYTWSFGDGGVSSSQNPSHTYTAPGTYLAQLTISDANGASAAASPLSMTIAPGSLVASASATPAAGDAPLATTLTSSATGGTPPYTYAWDLGDGTSSTVQSPSHSYSAGTYTATVTVSDGRGQTSQAAARFTVYPTLSVSTSAAPTAGVAPLTVGFTASATGGLAPYTFTWNFHDGGSGSGSTTTHSFGAGSFRPNLTVYDSAGGVWSEDIAKVIVSSPPPAPASGSGPANPAAGSAPGGAAPSAPTEPTPSTEPSPSPQTSPPASGAAAAEPPSRGSGSGDSSGLLLMLIGSALATGLGGGIFVGWRRLRMGWLRLR